MEDLGLNKENSNVDIQENDEYFELKKSKSIRRMIMIVFLLVVLGTQNMLSEYACKHNDSFGIMFSFYALINIFIFPAVIAVIAIKLAKSNLKQNKSILDSIIVWNIISLFNGIIPIFVFGKVGDSFFRINRSIFELYIFENLIISIIGSIILQLYVINKIKREL